MSNNLRSRIGHTGAVAVFALLAAGALTATPALASSSECPNEQLRQESNTDPATSQPYSVGLPECRAYEMVSPLDKQAHDANVANTAGGPLVSPDGEAVAFGSEGAFAGAENYLVNLSPRNTYIARRTPNGWATQSALAPASVISKPTSYGFNGDASLDLSTLGTCGNVADVTGAQGNSPNFACAIREPPDGTWARTPSYTDLTGEAPNSPVFFWGSSSDLANMVWQTGSAAGLLPGDVQVPSGSGTIYETTGLGTGSPQLRMVSVNNEDTPLTTEGGNNGPYLGAANRVGHAGDVYQAISSDGQTVYFTAEPAGGGALTLYARTGDFAGGTPASPITVTIAEEATYVGASADGSKVFFTTAQSLAPTDHDSTSDLYEYDFDGPAGHHYIQVSAGGLGDPSPGSGADVEPHDVVGISSDGSHVYVSSRAVLTTLPNGNGEHASAGQGGTYGYDTETGQTQFVSSGVEGFTTAQVTPDGRYLIFTTSAHLSPEDTNSGTAIYRYDFQTGELTWVSHAAPGFAALNEGDNATLPPHEVEQDGAMAYFGDARRAISENGEYIVFTTSEKLQADDVSGAPQVYLWHDRTVSLISDGENRAGVTEAPGMSASGSDIVFDTTSKLVGQDTDNLQDIYDARTDGGFPAPTPEPSCSGESCQGTPSSAPGFGTPGSQAFTGGGNLTPGPTTFPLPAEEAKPKPLTRAQKLTKALKGCKKDKSKSKRKSCEKAAKTQYGPKTKTKKKK